MKFIIPETLTALVVPRLRAIVPDCEIVHVSTEMTFDGDPSDAEVLFRWWSPGAVLQRTLDAAPRVRWVHTPSAGVDHFFEIIKERDLLVTTSAGAAAPQIAEFVMLMMLAHVKQARALMHLAPERAWESQDALQLQELTDKTVLILGLGQIGQELARRAAAFGMRVWGSRRTVRPTEHIARVVGEDGWRALLPEVDFVVVATPLTAATHGMINAETFAQMKPSAYLINVARGEIVDTDALLGALHSGGIAGAALDALPQEPLPPEHPLWRAPNVWITPHISWNSPYMRVRGVDIFIDNVPRFLAGAPLVNQVDLQAGY